MPKCYQADLTCKHFDCSAFDSSSDSLREHWEPKSHANSVRRWPSLKRKLATERKGKEWELWAVWADVYLTSLRWAVEIKTRVLHCRPSATEKKQCLNCVCVSLKMLKITKKNLLCTEKLSVICWMCASVREADKKPGSVCNIRKCTFIAAIEISYFVIYSFHPGLPHRNFTAPLITA